MLCTGIFSIEVGAIASDGGVSTTFAPLGRTREGTLAFNASDDQTQDINVEEQDDPIMQTVTTKGTLDISWSMTDWENSILTSIFAGSVVNNQISRQIDSHDKRINMLLERWRRQEATYYQMFARMESAMMKLQTQQNNLASIMMGNGM